MIIQPEYSLKNSYLLCMCAYKHQQHMCEVRRKPVGVTFISPSQSFCRSNSCCQDWWQVPKKGNIFLCSLETCYVDQTGLKLLPLPPPARIKVQLQHPTSELYYCEVCGLEAQFTSQQSFLWILEGTLVSFQTDSNKLCSWTGLMSSVSYPHSFWSFLSPPNHCGSWLSL